MAPEGVTLYAKCEFLNPSGSIKDRIAVYIIEDAEQSGLIRQLGGEVISSGSRGNYYIRH